MQTLLKQMIAQSAWVGAVEYTDCISAELG